MRTAISTDRQEQRAWYAPASLKAHSQCALAHAAFTRPLRNRHSAAVVVDRVIAPFITPLFAPRRPPDISRFVVSVIVNAVEGVFAGRTRPDMVQKLLKRCETKINAATAIVCVACMVRAMATMFGAGVGVCFWRAIPSMFVLCLRSDFFSQAPAASRSTPRQLLSTDDGYVPARALTIPSFLSSKTENGQALEYLTRSVDKTAVFQMWMENNVRIVASHIGSFIANVMRPGLVRPTPFRAVFIIPQEGSA